MVNKNLLLSTQYVWRLVQAPGPGRIQTQAYHQALQVHWRQQPHVFTRP